MGKEEMESWGRLKEMGRLNSLLAEKLRNPFSQASESELRSIEKKIKELADKK